MNSVEIAKKNGYKEGDTIAICGNAYRITHLGDIDVLGVQVVEKGVNVYSESTRSLNLTLDGWKLVI